MISSSAANTGKALLPGITLDISNTPEWYVLYTYPRAEKLVRNELLIRNYETFLPVIRTMRLWRNRQKKWIDSILFPGYLFVHTVLNEIYHITRVPKVVNCIQFAGRPATVSANEIDCIKKIISLDEELMITTQFFEGEKVRIISGPLAGYTGTLINYKGKTRFSIQLNEIHHSMLIVIRTHLLDKLPSM